MLHAEPVDDSDEEWALVRGEEVSEGKRFMPRARLLAERMDEGPILRAKRKLGNRFTRGTDPAVKDVVRFMADQTITCP